MRGGTLFVAHEPSVFQAITTVLTGANDFDIQRSTGSTPPTLFVASTSGVYEVDWDWLNAGQTLPWDLTAISGAPAATHIRIEVVGGLRTLFGMDTSGDLFVLQESSGVWSTLTSGVPTITGLTGVKELLPFRMNGGATVDTLGILTGTELRIYPFSGGLTTYSASGWTYQGAAIIGQSANNIELVAAVATAPNTQQYISLAGAGGLASVALNPVGPVTSVASGHYSDTNYDDLALYSPTSTDTNCPGANVTIWQDMLEPQGLQLIVVPAEVDDSVASTSVAVAALGDIDGDLDGDILIGLDEQVDDSNIAIHLNSQIAYTPDFDEEAFIAIESEGEPAELYISLDPVPTGIPSSIEPTHVEVVVFKEENGVMETDPMQPESKWYVVGDPDIYVPLGFDSGETGDITRHFIIRYIQAELDGDDPGDIGLAEVVVGHEPLHLIYQSQDSGDPCQLIVNYHGICLLPGVDSLTPYSREDKVGQGGGGIPGGGDPPSPFP